MTRDNQKKYIEDAKKFIQTRIPQGPDCQRAQFIIERAISQQYIQRAETVVTWSSCGRQTAIRPIDEACNPEDLAVFFRGLNASVQPHIKYTEIGSGFTLCKLGDSSEFNLSSNSGLKVTNQTGFISAGNYLIPWHFDEKGKQQAKLLNIPGQRYRRSAKWGDIIYVGYEYETQNELRFFGYTPKLPVIKSRDGEITETGQDLLSEDRELFLCLGKNGIERDQTGQMTRLWVVVPENYRLKVSPTISIDGFSITPEQKIITLTEGTYCLHLPVLFPQVKNSSGVVIPKGKIIKAALERKISAVFKANVLSTPEKLDAEEQLGDIYE